VSSYGRGWWLRERAVVLVMVFTIVVVLAVSGLAFYAMRNRVKFKVSATALKWFSVSIEVESQDRRQGGELPPSD
jgi:uncharacterized membrane protein YjjB (DUF3815 family)